MHFVSMRHEQRSRDCATTCLTFYVDLDVGNAALIALSPRVTAHQCIKARLFQSDSNCADSVVDHLVLVFWKHLAIQHPHSLTGSPAVVVKHTVHSNCFSRPGNHFSRDVAHC